MNHVKLALKDLMTAVKVVVTVVNFYRKVNVWSSALMVMSKILNKQAQKYV